MRSLGKLVGKSRSGRWLVRGNDIPPAGATVVNGNLEVLGQVSDVFGPVVEPFISVSVREPSPDVSPGDKVYVITDKDRRLRGWRSSRT